jgi:acyl-coenzyme A thioesterase PaaI-like protein
VIQLGGQVALAEGRITDAAGRLYAFATTTCLIFSLPPAAQ